MLDPTEKQEEEEVPKSQSEMMEEEKEDSFFGHINSEETPEEVQSQEPEEKE